MTERYIGVVSSEELENWQIQAWANINRFGDFNTSHEHGGLWSGIYYVDIGQTVNDKPVSGYTTFENQGCVVRKGCTSEHEYSIQPEPGLMLLFPASLRHHVKPYYGQGERITVAFNLRNSSFERIFSERGLREENWMWRNFRGFIIIIKYIRTGYIFRPSFFRHLFRNIVTSIQFLKSSVERR